MHSPREMRVDSHVKFWRYQATIISKPQAHLILLRHHCLLYFSIHQRPTVSTFLIYSHTTKTSNTKSTNNSTI